MSDSPDSSSRLQSPEINPQNQNSDSTDQQVHPNPSPRTSVPVRLSNPVPGSERPLLDITSDEQFFNTLSNNKRILINVHETLRAVDQTLLIIYNSIKENLLNQNIPYSPLNSSDQTMNSETQETVKKTGVIENNQQDLVVNSKGSSNTDTQAISNPQVTEESPDQSRV